MLGNYFAKVIKILHDYKILANQYDEIIANINVLMVFIVVSPNKSHL